MQQMAQGLASLGRGQDSMLVHMTPGEVHGLQSLARQHGGSLTINPQTGLPEAGFLSSILPMAAAAAAIYFTGGAAAPAVGAAEAGFMGLTAAQTGMLAGAATGALTNKQNPLMGGLMGGLSGYGMAGMMGGLASAGTLAPGTAPAPGDFLESQVATASTPTVAQVLPSVSPPVPPPAAVDPYLGSPAFASQAYGYADLIPSPSVAQTLQNATPVAPVVTAPLPAPVVSPPDLSAQYINSGINTPVTPPPQSYGNKLFEGAKYAVNNPIKFIQANPGATAATAIPLGLAGIQAMSAQPTLPASMAKQGTPTMFDNRQYSPGTRNPNFGQPGQPYFLGQGYTPSALSTAYAAAGGSTQDIQANSQPVMPPNQMIGGATPNENQFYPGANIARSGASYAPQAPSATEVVGGYDQNINQYTGEPVRMAGGGITYNQADQTYSGTPQAYLPQGSNRSFEENFARMIVPLFGGSFSETISNQQQQTAPQYNYNPDNQQYTLRMAKGGKAKALDTEINTDEPSERDIYENTDDDEIAKLQKILGRSIAEKSMAGGGIASLNEYAAGGRLLQGPGDGMSDSIPAVIKGARPQRAALAQGEFVLPADVVSHLGNGSTDAGSKRLYAMMDKIRHARTGSKKQGRQINPDKFMIA